jgi:hypothetical protein
MSTTDWRLAGDTLKITCNILYCNHQVHRDFLFTLYIHFQRLRKQENRKIYGGCEQFNQVLRPTCKSNGKRTNIEKNEEQNTEKITSSFTIFLLRNMALVYLTLAIFLSDCGIIFSVSPSKAVQRDGCSDFYTYVFLKVLKPSDYYITYLLHGAESFSRS